MLLMTYDFVAHDMPAHDEQCLLRYGQAYAEYMQRSWMLIPFVY